MTGFCGSFGGDGHQNLVALAGDEVDRNLDLFLVGPFIDQITADLVGPGDPMIPKAHREFAGRMRGSDKRRGDQRRRRQRASSYELPSRKPLP